MRMLRDFKRGDLLVSERLDRRYLVLSVVPIGDSKTFGFLNLREVGNDRDELLPPDYFGHEWQVIREAP